MDGVLIIDKSAGLTSHDVVDQVRHILGERRIGHTGTLDPFATGVLVMMVGRATRLAQFLSGLEKEYEAIIRLGYATDTGDITGKPIHSSRDDFKRADPWSKQQIEAALQSLRGEIEQVPPMYSAKKLAGRKLYELARQGEEVERKPVLVCIQKFEPIRPTGELLKDNLDGTFDFEVRVECSAGTYVRTLAEDFGEKLKVGAHLAELRRTRVGDFEIHRANTLEQIKVSFAEDAIGTILLPPAEALSRMPAVDLSDEDLRRVRNGMDVQVSQDNVKDSWQDGERVRMRGSNYKLIAIGSFDAARGLLHPSVVIAPESQ